MYFTASIQGGARSSLLLGKFETFDKAKQSGKNELTTGKILWVGVWTNKGENKDNWPFILRDGKIIETTAENISDMFC